MILTERLEGIETVRFDTDRIDALNVMEIRAAIMRLFEEQHVKAIIDFTGVEYLDSSGFGMLLLINRTVKSNFCSMKLCSLSDKVLGLFETLKLDTAFDIYPDLEACIVSYKKGGSF